MKSREGDAGPRRCGPRQNTGSGKRRSEAASRHATAGAAKIRIVNKKYEQCGFSKACRVVRDSIELFRTVARDNVSSVSNALGWKPRIDRDAVVLYWIVGRKK